MLFPLLLAATTTAPNLLLVTIDTLRADRIGAYGCTTAHTPVLDRLAREGVLVEDAVVQVPQTRPSHASILTGRYPYEHRIRDNYSPPLDRKVPTLATLLKARGYLTAAFIGAYPVARTSGLDVGFDVYDDPFGGGENATTRQAAQERTALKVTDAALAWLDQPRTQPFFAWVHFFDPHTPYEAPAAPFGRRFAKSPYDGEVAYADSQLGRLLEWLDRSGGRGQTLVVVTSDHGESLGEHGEDEHMIFVYDATLRVPLLVSWPGRLSAGVRVKGQFRSIDIVPTALELLGLPGAPTSGASRAEALRSGSRIPDNESYAESLYGSLHHGWAPLYSLRGEGFKLIEAPRPELYHLVNDPGETRNLVEARSAVASGMRAHLSIHRKGEEAAGPPEAPVDAALAERLAALGYVGGGPFSGRGSGADPKDEIAGYQVYARDTQQALRLFQERKFTDAIRILSRLSKASSVEGTEVVQRRSFLVEYNLGRSLLETERYEEAVPHLEAALAMTAAYVPARVFLARALGGARRPADALVVVDQGLADAPANPDLLHAKGSLLLRRGDLPGARMALEAAKGHQPSSVSLRVDLAYLYRSLGNLALAGAEADEALRLDPRAAEAHVEKGLVLGALGREEEAGRAFKSALETSPHQPQALYYMAAVEMRRGRADNALPLLERLRKAAPGYPGLNEALAAARQAATSPAASAPRVSTPRATAPAAGTIRLRLLRVGDRDRAQEVARRVRAGEDFAALARAFSEDASAAQGGEMGLVPTSDLAEPMRSAAARLGVGQTTPLLETPKGYVILKREK